MTRLVIARKAKGDASTIKVKGIWRKGSKIVLYGKVSKS